MKPDKIYSYFKGEKELIPCLHPALARAIKKHGTCICIEPTLKLFAPTQNWPWVASRLDLLMMLGRGIPVFALKAAGGWRKVKL